MLLFVSAASAQPKAPSTGKRSSISPTLLAKAKAGDTGAQYRLERSRCGGGRLRVHLTNI
jgi:hypothetical protein